MNGLWTRLLSSNEVLAVLVTAALSFLGWIALRIIAPRGHIIWGVSHHFSFLSQTAAAAPLVIHTRNVALQNAGRAVVQDVQVSFSIRPEHFEVWPRRPFTEAPAQNAFVLNVGDFNPQELLSIHMISVNQDLPFVMTVRWRGGSSDPVPMSPQRVWPAWALRGMALLSFTGAIACVYLFIRLLQGIL